MTLASPSLLVVRGVQAVKTARLAPASSHFVRPPCAEFVPFAPGKPTLRGRTDALITMEWTIPRNNGHRIDRFELQMARADTPHWVMLSNNIPDNSHMATDLIPVKKYAFRVRAHNLLGWGPWSEVSDLVKTSRRF